METVSKEHKFHAHAPTSLHLFDHSPVQLAHLRPRAASVDKLKCEVITSRCSFKKLDEASTRRYQRLDQAREDVFEDLYDLQSSTTCSRVFQKMTEEFAGRTDLGSGRIDCKKLQDKIK